MELDGRRRGFSEKRSRIFETHRFKRRSLREVVLDSSWKQKLHLRLRNHGKRPAGHERFIRFSWIQLQNTDDDRNSGKNEGSDFEIGVGIYRFGMISL
ncbi:MAG: hypothetical protein RIS20_1093 [Bacteroidota bacterium]